MTLRATLASILLGAFLCAAVSCAIPVGDYNRNIEGRLDNVERGSDMGAVEKTLGKPDSGASGWWSGSHRFDMTYRVWYYKGVGRVVFDHEMVVYTTEADKTEDGRP